VNSSRRRLKSIEVGEDVFLVGKAGSNAGGTVFIDDVRASMTLSLTVEAFDLDMDNVSTYKGRASNT
jgi:hypothetical protein